MKYKETDYNRLYSDFQRKGRINRCFYCGAENKITSSHSISEKRCLNLLAEYVEGRKGVYGFKHLKLSRTNWHNPNHFGNFEVIGIKEASTFKGFCKVHDQKLFKLLDESNFDETSIECKFLHCYRAFAKAVHTKREEFKSCSSDSIYKERNQKYIAERKEAIGIGLHFDLCDYDYLMTEWLKNQDYTQLEHFCLKRQCPIFCVNEKNRIRI